MSAVSPLWLMAKTSVSPGHRRIAMAELARELDLDRQAGELLDDVFADPARVQRSAAPGEHDAVDRAQFRRRHVEAAELGGAFLVAEAAAHRVAHRSRLLKDLLEHVMRVVALLDVFVGELDLADLVMAAFAGERADLEFLPLDRDDIEVVQVNRVARVGDDRADVAGEEVFLFADAEHERAAASRADDEIRDVLVHERDAVGADDLLQRGTDGDDEPALRVRAPVSA